MLSSSVPVTLCMQVHPVFNIVQLHPVFSVVFYLLFLSPLCFIVAMVLFILFLLLFDSLLTVCFVCLLHIKAFFFHLHFCFHLHYFLFLSLFWGWLPLLCTRPPYDHNHPQKTYFSVPVMLSGVCVGKTTGCNHTAGKTTKSSSHVTAHKWYLGEVMGLSTKSRPHRWWSHSIQSLCTSTLADNQRG